ncbi:hypothetical protein F441_16362 [Phytophthora nicotianae CJ01A1]|uniref:Uncharacterized protein n=6 Tax=Phytophthora nicotianae TaxID=4792 RepID=W2PQM7_PHYN3|nr:hypothetical protein PPTG_23842 [Phytophthora nicotianae INRA-310]ETI37457.1 hypothetical protein F443_16548 [Phytophthora nicotianae P1569]ETK77680.1 hypothetical protein L915_16076 [Phytophthora nicotianae]ETO66233.1 hypothetical protein F444_16523 [Phytophthora nicotianae P1976]ETP07318.1 hypothetical protein F441_16362 [Phytophthora nicotianae CJ01A1]ETP35391.1 hypothetical protein F442_16386 [Phytophthora nicotianae P10297]
MPPECHNSGASQKTTCLPAQLNAHRTNSPCAVPYGIFQVQLSTHGLHE